MRPHEDAALEAARDRVGHEHLRHHAAPRSPGSSQSEMTPMISKTGSSTGTVAERLQHRQLDALADRIFRAEVARDQRLVDDRHLARVVDFGRRERAAAGQPESQRLEIALAAQLEDGSPSFRCASCRRSRCRCRCRHTAAAWSFPWRRPRPAAHEGDRASVPKNRCFSAAVA